MARTMVEPMKLLLHEKKHDSNGMPTRKSFSKRERIEARPDKAWIAPPQKQLISYQRSIDDLLFAVKQK
jgi:hypothetical protein|tara:strand:+ start:2395 stop:2601 length:207 start_codon:yes stop_codon:yes gene_type:complete